jgi:hypothetical protein
MLRANPSYKPAALRDANYRDRRGAVYLFFAKDLDRALPDRASSYNDDDVLSVPVTLVKMLRSQGNQDLMQRIVMML